MDTWGTDIHNRISEVKLSLFKKSYSAGLRAYTIPRGFLQWLREASQLGFLRKLCSVYFYDFSVTLASPLQLLLGEIDMRLSADIII